MADTENSIHRLIANLVHDTRELIREEIALARAEIQEQISYGQTVGIAFGAAAVAGIIGVILLCVGLANAIAYFLSWPAWAGYAIVAIVLLIIAFALMQYGRSKLKNVRGLTKTTQSMKDNLAWMQNRIAGK